MPIKIESYFQIDPAYSAVGDSSVRFCLFGASADPSCIRKVLIIHFLVVFEVIQSQIFIEIPVYFFCSIYIYPQDIEIFQSEFLSIMEPFFVSVILLKLREIVVESFLILSNIGWLFIEIVVDPFEVHPQSNQHINDANLLLLAYSIDL